VDRLRKLIAMEGSARAIGNQAEAEAFAAKIAEQLTRHRLERSDVEAQAEVAEPIGQTKADAAEAGWTKQAHNAGAIAWMVQIAQGCAAATGVGLLWSGSQTAVFCGPSEPREGAKQLYLYMIGLAQTFSWKEGQKEKAAIVAECKRKFGEGCFGRQSQAMKEYRASYCAGFGSTVGRRLSATAKAQIDAAPGTAMVWVRRTDAAIEAYVNQTKTGTTKQRDEFNRHNASAYFKGRDRGENVALTSKVVGR
jgi:hypothetical protein